MARREIWVADAETDPFRKYRVPKPFIWGAYNGETFFHFEHSTCTQDFVEFMKGKEAICYAHNGGKFDWHYLLPYLSEYDEDLLLIHGRIAKMKIGICEFRDSFSILPVPLAAYEKTEIDYSIFEENERIKPHNKEKIKSYLNDDLKGLYEIVKKFIDRFGNKLTLAGAALSQWQKITDQDAPKTNGDYYDRFSCYYYGGRVEALTSGIIERDFVAVDINSAYPYAMKTGKHAIGIDAIDKQGTPPAIKPDMFFTLECISNGAFPYRDEKKKLSFPRDGVSRIYHVTGWELIAALETKTISQPKFLRYVKFTELHSFKDYIDEFYSERLIAKELQKTAKGDELKNAKATDLFCKLFMNSLYGKFGANPRNYSKYIIVPQDALQYLIEQQEEYKLSGFLGPWALGERDLEEKEQHFYNVVTSASITGFVRAMLWRAICSCEDIIYCDTDCIICGKLGDEITIGKELGQWEIEGYFSKAGIAGKKLYILKGKDCDGKEKYKTASKGAKLTKRELWTLAQGKAVYYEPESPIYSPVKEPYFLPKIIIATEGEIAKQGKENAKPLFERRKKEKRRKSKCQTLTS